MQERRTRLIGLLVPAALLLSGCLASGELVVVASAPREGGGITILLAGIDLEENGQATYVIKKDGRAAYPPGGRGVPFPVAERKGEAFVPYEVFVTGNGPYDVEVSYDGVVRAANVRVEKWVEYVYLHPVAKGSNVVVDVILAKEQGGLPSDRVIAEGRLILDVMYRGIDGSSRERVKVVTTATPEDETFTRVVVPRAQLNKGPGYYSFDATFHNNQALGNNGVGNDPTMANRDPPWNWICIDTCT